jgi:hypothetical protein
MIGRTEMVKRNGGVGRADARVPPSILGLWQYPLGYCNKSVRCHAGFMGYVPPQWTRCLPAAQGGAVVRRALAPRQSTD